MKDEFFLSENLIPKGFTYPNSYKQFVNKELPDLEPWYFLNKHIEFQFNGLKQRYPKRCIVPFARRSDNDDVACFEAGEPSTNPQVIIIHDWASEGWEGRGEYEDFLAWVELAKIESREWKEFWINYNRKNDFEN